MLRRYDAADYAFAAMKILLTYRYIDHAFAYATLYAY